MHLFGNIHLIGDKWMRWVRIYIMNAIRICEGALSVNSKEMFGELLLSFSLDPRISGLNKYHRKSSFMSERGMF